MKEVHAIVVGVKNSSLISFFILFSIFLYFIILPIGGIAAALSAVGAMLLGVIITGLFLAVSMTIL